MNLDFSLLNWALIQNFILKGLWFSITLTVVATLGGIFFGTLLALMRLSGKKWLDVPAAIHCAPPSTSIAPMLSESAIVEHAP